MLREESVRNGAVEVSCERTGTAQRNITVKTVKIVLNIIACFRKRIGNMTGDKGIEELNGQQ